MSNPRKFALTSRNYSYRQTFQTNGWTIVVRGRLDGRYQKQGQTICEEIKSSFDLVGLEKTLATQAEHPYKLQVLSYAYLEYLKTGQVPSPRLLLISSRYPDQRVVLELPFDLVAIESWWQRRLKAICQRAIKWRRQTKRRQILAKQLNLPYKVS